METASRVADPTAWRRVRCNGRTAVRGTVTTHSTYAASRGTLRNPEGRWLVGRGSAAAHDVERPRIERTDVARCAVLDLELPVARRGATVERRDRQVGDDDVVGRAALTVPVDERRAIGCDRRDDQVAAEPVRDVERKRQRADGAVASDRKDRRDAGGVVVRDRLGYVRRVERAIDAAG